MNTMYSSPPYPRNAYLLSLIGGILILLYAFLVVGEALADRAQLESILPGAARLLIGLGILGIISGTIVIVGALQIRRNPGSAKTWGVIILLFSLISFVGGGGFIFIGLILGLIGGILALTWNPPGAVGSMYGAPGYGSPNPPMGSAPWGSSAPPASVPGGVQRFCSSCGSPNVPTAQFCAKCGAPMQ